MNATHRTGGWCAAAAMAMTGAGAAAGVSHFENFNTAGDYQGWTANGNQMIFPGGNGGDYIGVPYLDFWGMTLRNDNPASGVIGDLSNLDATTWSVDVRVFALDTFGGDPIDPGFFPVVLEFVDYGDPDNNIPFASVYTIGAALPAVAAGWSTLEYTVPSTNQAALPAGWGGTGAEDPNTFEPILPVGRTYQNVMASVDEVRFTTFVPGFFYGFNLWEVGWDNVKVAPVPAPSTGVLAVLGGLAAARRRRG